MEPLKVVGLALAKARFDLHYYGKKKPDSNPLRFEIEKQQHKIDKLVNERNNIGGQIRRLDVPEKRAGV
jgi:cell division protein FtsB